MVESTRKRIFEDNDEDEWIDRIIPRNMIVKHFLQFNWYGTYGWQPVFFIVLEPMPKEAYVQ